MTVGALLTGRGPVLCLLHGAVPPRRNGVCVHRGTSQTPRPQCVGVQRALAEAVTADGAWSKPLSVPRTWARRSRKALTPSAASRLAAVRPSRAHAGVRLPTRSRTGRVPLRLLPG